MERLARERGRAAFDRAVFTVEPWRGTVPTSADEIACLPAHRLAALVKDRKITSLELTDLYLARLKRLDPVLLYHPPFWLRHLAALLMLPVFPLLLATYLPGRIKAAVKHPMLTATKAWAVSHLLVNGMLSDVLLFGGFLAWAVLARISAGKRPQPAAATATPSIRNDVIAVVLGLVLYVAFAFWAHPRWIGVPVMP